jgi:hypothetical protein
MDQQYHKLMPGAPNAGPCLLRSFGGVRAAVGAAAQWHSTPDFSACCAGLQCKDGFQKVSNNGATIMRGFVVMKRKYFEGVGEFISE